MNDKKCNYCEKGLINFTSFGSNNKAEVFIQELNILTFYGDDGASYYLQCNYCPFCGKKLRFNLKFTVRNFNKEN